MDGGRMVLVLLGVLALAVFGCACVVWSQRGGPPWSGKVATGTLAAGAVVRALGKSRGGGSGGGGNGGGDGG
ncbi:hypothetical protein [Streptomyces sp. NPDC020141]|uniref:hypothetical protein n=1 Tax=Streptomyces sp. NPDC020141 TaxID=3365065 RepID=UPI0037B3693A